MCGDNFYIKVFACGRITNTQTGTYGHYELQIQPALTYF